MPSDTPAMEQRAMGKILVDAISLKKAMLNHHPNSRVPSEILIAPAYTIICRTDCPEYVVGCSDVSEMYEKDIGICSESAPYYSIFISSLRDWERDFTSQTEEWKEDHIPVVVFTDRSVEHVYLNKSSLLHSINCSSSFMFSQVLPAPLTRVE